MSDNTSITVSKPTTTLNMFANQESFTTGYKMAQVLSASTIVPRTFQNNVGNTMIAIDMAQRLHTNPLMIMQNIYIVYGQPAFSAKFLIACINASGLFASPLRYEFVGEQGKDNWGCYAFAIDKQGEVLKGSTVTILQAKQKGWYNREGSNWMADPEQMLRYRAATRFQTAYCPELSCGLATKEELEDIEYTEITRDNIDKLSAEQEVARAQKKEKQEANSQTMDMNVAKPSTGANVSENKTGVKKSTTAQPATKVQPMGKQDVPDMFK